MTTRTVYFRIPYEPATDGVLRVDIHGGNPFLGISVWHTEIPPTGRMRTITDLHKPYYIVSRSRFGRDDEKEVFEDHETTTFTHSDPLIAAETALKTHLERIPDHYPSSECQEPICTAVMAMCLDTSLYRESTLASPLRAVGGWNLNPTLSDDDLNKLSGIGQFIHDVFVGEDNPAFQELINTVWR